MKLQVRMDPAISDEELEQLVADYRYGRYCEDSALPIPQARRQVLARLRQFRQGPAAHCIGACSLAGDWLGLVLFSRSSWDSEHFGYPVVVIESALVKNLGYSGESAVVVRLLEELDVWCQAQKIRFVSVRVSARDLPLIHGLEGAGFRFIESWIFNKYELEKLPEQKIAPRCLRPARPGDLDLMIEYSRDAFATQRFHADPVIDPERADSLYRKWIQTAFTDPGRRILAMDIGEKPAAFLVYSESDLTECLSRRYAMWNMALLDPASRGQGVGREFFAAALHHHRASGFDVVDSGLSMRNLASLNLHNRTGFKVVATMITFHRWLAPG